MNRIVKKTEIVIGGAGFGGGKGASGGGGTEAPDSLRSRQSAKIVDLLGEGPNVGIVGFAKGIYLNGVALQNADNTFNFSNAVVQQVLGYPDQPVIAGFGAQQSEVAVSAIIRKATPLTRHIENSNTDRVRITVSVPSLQDADIDSGDIKGTTVSYQILVQNNGGGYQSRGTFSIKGKTSSRYQRATILELPRPGPWDIRLVRTTNDSGRGTLQNDLYWDGYTEIIDAKVNYSNSHCVGIIIDAEQFSSIPKRTYLVDGRIIQVPSNYNPETRVYTGVWNGTFKNAWSNNPAWVFYDMVTHPRYGLGRFLGAADVDKWALYEIAQFCDVPVDNGKGGKEPRFVANIAIVDRYAAFDVLTSLASIFRGFAYWNGGQLTSVADQPRPVSGIYTAANVIEGRFEYAGADIRARHNMIKAGWSDNENLGEHRISIAEDIESISKLGIQEAEVEAIGATTEAQALRSAKWQLYTENYEAETVSFSVGLAGAWCKPGDVIAIADRVVGGERRGGRVWKTHDSFTIELDGTVEIAAGQVGWLSVLINGKVETQRVTSNIQHTGVGRCIITTYGSFSAPPEAGTPWVLASGDLLTTTWRVITVEEAEGEDYFRVNALRHREDKWSYVENNMALTPRDETNINTIPPPVTDMKVEQSLMQINVNTVSAVALVSWQSMAPQFDVDARPDQGNWIRRRVQTTATEFEVTEGWWEFQVTPVSMIGRKGGVQTIRTEIIGRFAPPATPQQFRVVAHEGSAMFRWLPTTEIDVKVGGHYELRYAPRVSGATWDTAQPVIQSIPGAASSVDAFYQAGTWFLKAFDIVGLESPEAAVIVTNEPDTSYTSFTRICEDPAWTGAKVNTEIRMPQEWLVLTAGATQGTYEFANMLNIGAAVQTRLSLDLLAFPFFENAVFMDEREGSVDSWQNWDNEGIDLNGLVRIEMRSTQTDPAGTPAWSEWVPFTNGDVTAWAFQFRAVLTATPGQNIAVETLCILADLRNKIDEGGDIPFAPPGPLTVPFNIDFFFPPAITVTIQEALTGDSAIVTNKTPESFDIKIVNSAGTAVSRTFDWHAIGY
jgi:predicted phage tail protein